MIVVILVFLGRAVLAQALGFDMPNQACKNQNLVIQNTSGAGYSSFIWDFCEGDISESVQSLVSHSANTIGEAAGIQVVEESGILFGLFADRASNAIFLAEFGTSLNNTPTITNISLPGVLLSPQGLKAVKVSDSWHCFVVSAGNNKLFRIDFGSSLKNTPTVVELNFQGNLNTPVELEIVKDSGQYYLLVLNFSANNVVSAKLGNLITTLTPVSFKVSPVTGAGNPYGLSLKKYSDGVWRGVTGSFSNGAFHSIEFINGLGESPLITNISTLLPAIVNPTKLSLVNWGKENVLLVMAASGSVHRIKFSRGSLFSSVEFADVVNSSFGATLALSTWYDKGNWRCVAFSNSTKNIHVINFNKNCPDVNIQYSFGENPSLISYSSASVYDITIRATNDGFSESLTKELVVTDDVAPQLMIQNTGVCLQSPVGFSVQSDQSLVLHLWNFGDTQTSSVENPSHQYASIGEYEASVSVTAVNGCDNYAEKSISIFNEPLPDFQPPSTTPICTNQLYTFTNTSTFDAGYQPMWQWLVDGVPVSTQSDLAYAFQSTGSKEVKLQASIPGCMNESTQTIGSVEQGPLVDFFSSGQCEDENISFTNTTTGSVTSYLWDFGDGQSSAAIDPTHIFADPATYQVSLSATNAAGCNNSKTASLPVYSRPQPDFVIPLPPFACTGLSTPFTDQTPNPFDSNLASWLWDFGDGGATSTLRNTMNTYIVSANYNVSLTVTTNFGCSSVIQKTVPVSQSPIASFSNTPPCRDVKVNFSDGSQGSIRAWRWQIENASFTVANPEFTFSTSGNKNITLTVTDANGCESTTNRVLVVPVVPTVDFSFSKNCINQQTEFTDNTMSSSDPVASRLWTITGVGSGTANPQLFMFTSLGNYNTRLSVTTQSGCTYTTQKNVIIVNAPQASFSATPLFGVPPLQVQFTNTSTNASSYLWSFNDAVNSTSTAVSPTFTFNELGTYAVSLSAMSSQGCISLSSKNIQAIIPQYNVSVSNLELIQQPDQSVNPVAYIHNTSNVPVSNLPLLFSFAEGEAVRVIVTAVIQPDEVYRFPAPFSLPAARIVRFGCAEIDFDDLDATDNKFCITLNNRLQAIHPYPNPVSGSDELTIEWIAESDRSVQVMVVNTSGQRVFEIIHQSGAGLNAISIPAGSWQPGIYIIRVGDGASSHVFRVAVLE